MKIANQIQLVQTARLLVSYLVISGIKSGVGLDWVRIRVEGRGLRGRRAGEQEKGRSLHRFTERGSVEVEISNSSR